MGYAFTEFNGVSARLVPLAGGEWDKRILGTTEQALALRFDTDIYTHYNIIWYLNKVRNSTQCDLRCEGYVMYRISYF